MANMMLTVKGEQIIDSEGKLVILRGLGLGGWMNMENFITGFPASEERQRQAVRAALGDKLYEFFFDRFLAYFFEEDDAAFIASLGLNLLRLPINYRHFESDMEPFVIQEAGFKHLDRVIELCARHKIYTIIDLHALPGYQNQDWHSDNPTHRAFFWQHRHFQDRVVNLWEVIAARYKSNPWVAGYNPINEPADSSEKVVVAFYRRLYEAMRAVDPEHIVFLEGNRYGLDFHMFPQPWPNVVYTAHDYARVGSFAYSGSYPDVTEWGEYVDKEALERTFRNRTAYMRESQAPIWIGEFGAAYTGNAESDVARYAVVRDQLDIYNRYGASWALWTYKDIGVQGLVTVSPDAPWMQRLGPLLKKKARLGVDAWSSLDTGIRHLMQPLEETFAKEFRHYHPYPFGASWMIERLVRHILLAEPLVEEFGALFKSMDEEDIDTLMQSFRFKNCVQRAQLAKMLAEYA